MKIIGGLILLFGFYGMGLIFVYEAPKIWEHGHFMAFSIVSIFTGASVISSDIKAKKNPASYFQSVCVLNLTIYTLLSMLLFAASFMAYY